MSPATLLEEKPVADLPESARRIPSVELASEEVAETPAVAADQLHGFKVEPERTSFSEGLTSVLAAAIPCSADRRRLEMRTLRQAGHYESQAWQNLAAARYLGVTLPLMLFGVSIILVPAQYDLVMGRLLIGSCWLGWTLPWRNVRRRARARAASISRGLPDLIDLVAAAVAKGVGPRDALEAAGRSLRTAHPALADEVHVVCQQARVDTLERALARLGDCFSTSDVRGFAALVADAQQLGSGISKALYEHAAHLRECLRLQSEWAARRALFQQTLVIASLLVPACCLLLWTCIAPESLAALIG